MFYSYFCFMPFYKLLYNEPHEYENIIRNENSFFFILFSLWWHIHIELILLFFFLHLVNIIIKFIVFARYLVKYAVINRRMMHLHCHFDILRGAFIMTNCFFHFVRKSKKKKKIVKVNVIFEND